MPSNLHAHCIALLQPCSELTPSKRRAISWGNSMGSARLPPVFLQSPRILSPAPPSCHDPQTGSGWCATGSGPRRGTSGVFGDAIVSICVTISLLIYQRPMPNAGFYLVILTISLALAWSAHFNVEAFGHGVTFFCKYICGVSHQVI